MKQLAINPSKPYSMAELAKPGGAVGETIMANQETNRPRVMGVGHVAPSARDPVALKHQRDGLGPRTQKRRNPLDPIQIDENLLSHPDDLKAAIALVELCREIGNSAPLRPFSKREVMPGNLRGADREHFIRDAVMPYWHETCTAKMGLDAMSVVDGKLKVYGIKNLRIADGSVMPRVTTGNTMAPCVVIGERAAEVLRTEHKLQTSVIEQDGKDRGADLGEFEMAANREELVL
jgi:Choline dehydrogenase and related flavoproteins